MILRISYILARRLKRKEKNPKKFFPCVIFDKRFTMYLQKASKKGRKTRKEIEVKNKSMAAKTIEQTFSI